MLVLSRKQNQSILIGDDILVTIAAIDGNRVKVGIQAPGDVKIMRWEIVPMPTGGQNANIDDGNGPSEPPLPSVRCGEIGQDPVNPNVS